LSHRYSKIFTTDIGKSLFFLNCYLIKIIMIVRSKISLRHRLTRGASSMSFDSDLCVSLILNASSSYTSIVQLRTSKNGLITINSDDVHGRDICE